MGTNVNTEVLKLQTPTGKSAENQAESLAFSVLDVVGHLDEVLDVLSEAVGTNKAATMADCAQRYLVDLEALCRQAIATAKAGGVQ